MYNDLKLNEKELSTIYGGKKGPVKGLICPKGKGLMSGKCYVDVNWAVDQAITNTINGFVGGLR